MTLLLTLCDQHHHHQHHHHHRHHHHHHHHNHHHHHHHHHNSNDVASHPRSVKRWRQKTQLCTQGSSAGHVNLFKKKQFSSNSFHLLLQHQLHSNWNFWCPDFFFRRKPWDWIFHHKCWRRLHYTAEHSILMYSEYLNTIQTVPCLYFSSRL